MDKENVTFPNNVILWTTNRDEVLMHTTTEINLKNIIKNIGKNYISYDLCSSEISRTVKSIETESQ